MSDELLTIEEALDFQDRLPDTWKRYRVGITERREQNGWTIEPFSIDRDCAGRKRYILEGGLDRDCGWGDGFTMLKKNGVIWMSDTRAEIMEHSPFINKLWWLEDARPRVLINGLGLGMAVRAALVHGAEHVDVVEIDQDVIDLIGPTFANDPVTIHHADAFGIKWPEGTTWTLAWHDIWPAIDDDNLPGMAQLRAKYENSVEWQDCWQEAGCRAMEVWRAEFQEALASGDLARCKQLDPHF